MFYDVLVGVNNYMCTSNGFTGMVNILVLWVLITTMEFVIF